ncbi:MAG TPA: helix-turn-helix domain-containing protein [Polyangiaceae bacterium]|nr:helix-turn-helix domain-containing protein [Polyangiaceae bacterium]
MKRTPLPPSDAARGAPRSGRRLTALLDLLGRRWSLRVLWELRKKKRKFRDLRAACDDVSPSVLNQRLGELRLAGVVAHDAEGYALTARGLTLLEVLAPLEGLASRWPLGEARSRAAAPRPVRTAAAPPKARSRRARARAAPARPARRRAAR